jgi:predicted transcriptional regulator
MNGETDSMWIAQSIWSIDHDSSFEDITFFMLDSNHQVVTHMRANHHRDIVGRSELHAPLLIHTLSQAIVNAVHTQLDSARGIGIDARIVGAP